MNPNLLPKAFTYGAPPIKRVNTQATGATQIAGKTTTIIAYDAVPTADADDCTMIFADADGSGGLTFTGHVIEMGMEDRLIILDLNRSIYGGWGVFRKSANNDLHERRKENRAFARMIAESLTVHRGQSIDETRTIKEWVLAAVRAWQEHPFDLHPTEMGNFLRPWTSARERLVEALPEGSLKYKLMGLRSLFQSPSQFWASAGAALRLLEETFDEPTIAEMLAKTFDLEEALRERKIIVVIGGPDEFVNRVVIKALCLAVRQTVVLNWGMTHEPLPVRIYVDESNSILTMTEAISMNRDLKKGLSWCVLGQTADYGDQLVNERVDSGCTEKLMFHAMSAETTEWDAHHLKGRMDPLKVKRTVRRQRMVNTGAFREIETVSEGESKDHEGRVRKDKRRGTSYQPIYAPEVEATDELYSLNEQGTLNEIATMQLGVGEFCRRLGKTVTGPHYIPKLPRPFQLEGLAEEYIEEVVQRLLSEGILRQPSASLPTWEPRKRPKPSKPPKLPPRAPANSNGKKNGKS